MMKKYFLAGSALLALSFATASVATAEDGQSSAASAFELGVTLGGVTDYVWRGVSQTDENPAVQGGVTVSHTSGLSAGLWASNVDFNDGGEADYELDATLAYTHPFAGADVTLSGIYYAYPGADDNLNYDFWEAGLTYARNVNEMVDVTAAVNYSPEFFGDTGDAVYANLGLSAPIKYVDGLSAKGSFGRQWVDDGINYNDWSAGLGYGWKSLAFDVKYTDTSYSKADCADLCDARVMAGLTWSFSTAD